jgi:hypothetical protein
MHTTACKHRRIKKDNALLLQMLMLNRTALHTVCGLLSALELLRGHQPTGTIAAHQKSTCTQPGQLVCPLTLPLLLELQLGVLTQTEGYR